jgi:hypothetical protein
MWSSFDIPQDSSQNDDMLRAPVYTLTNWLNQLNRVERVWVVASAIYFLVVAGVVLTVIPTEGRISAIWSDEAEAVFKVAGKDDELIGRLVEKRGQLGDITFARDAMLLVESVVDKRLAESKTASQQQYRSSDTQDGAAYYARIEAADKAVKLAKSKWEAALSYANTHDSTGASLEELQTHQRLQDMQQYREWLDGEMPAAMKHYQDVYFATERLIDADLRAMAELVPLRKRHEVELASVTKTQWLYSMGGLLAWAVPQAILFALWHLILWVRREPVLPD